MQIFKIFLMILSLVSGIAGAANTTICQDHLHRFSSSSDPAKFWEYLHHSVSVHALFQRVRASDLPETVQDLVMALELDHFAPTDLQSQNLHPYLIGSIEHIVDLLQRGVSKFERIEGPVHGPLGYERIGYRVVHPDQKVSYLMSKRLIEGCASCRERENVFLIAELGSEVYAEVIVTKASAGLELVEKHVTATEAEYVWSSFILGQHSH